MTEAGIIFLLITAMLMGLIGIDMIFSGLEE